MQTTSLIFDFYGVLYPYSKEAKQVVSKLSRTYKIGAISSLSPAMVKRISRYYDIEHGFCSIGLGMSKREEGLYHYFCKEYDFIKEKTIFIDDNQVRLEAAKHAGLNTAWYTDSDLPKFHTSDYKIDNLKQIFEII